MATTEDLLKIEEANQRNLKARAEWLKEKDWFIVLDADILFGEGGKVVYRISELEDELIISDDFKYKGKCEFVYRTNKWKESLEEFV